MNKIFKTALTYGIIIAIALLMAMSYHIFIVQNHFAPAGVGGIATMIQYKTGFNIGFMTLLVNIPLCIAVYFIVDRAFAVRSFVFTLVYSVTYYLLQQFGPAAIQYDAQGNDTIYPVIIAGVINGVVNGICIKQGLSSGGTAILAKCVNRYKPDTNFFVVDFAMNACVAVISLFVYSEVSALNYKPVALCVTYCFVNSFVGNYIIRNSRSAYKFTVITAHPQEIADEATHVLRHGATRIEATGVYTDMQKTILLCVVNKHQLIDFQNIISRYDNAFAFYETVNETYGNFKRLKAHV